FLIENNVNFDENVNDEDEDKFLMTSMIYEAVINGQVEIVKILIEKGLKVFVPLCLDKIIEECEEEQINPQVVESLKVATASKNMKLDASLPLEIIEEIIGWLPFEEQFVFSTSFGLRRIQSNVLPHISSLTPNLAGARGITKLLDRWFDDNRLTTDFGILNVGIVCINGHINVLQWLKDKNMSNLYEPTPKRIEFATMCGHVSVLDWWKHNGFTLTMTEIAIDLASSNGHVSVLDWWSDYDCDMKWTSDSMDCASENGHVNVLDWWNSREKKNNLKFTDKAMDSASKNGHIQVLEWWSKLKIDDFEVDWSSNAFNDALKNGHLDVLEWWKHSGFELKWDDRSVDEARKSGKTDAVKWFKKNLKELEKLRTI
ncbi:hypothetical protein HK096_006619, partial [Nowakowskiella sp. JEL0078]